MRTRQITRTYEKTNLSIKTKTLATIAAIVAAVALPQVIHVAGRLFGINTALGEMLLPMHLPVILVGLLAGPVAGCITGFMSPLLSYALSGMPVMFMLPIITIELFGYGLSAGLLKNVNIPTVAKVLSTQVTGRVFRALATVFIVFIIGAKAPAVATIWTSIIAGVAGIIVQLVSIPLIVRWIEHNK